MFEFKLPDLGEGIHEGEILKWHVAVGDTIAEDEPLVDIETDKAAVTIPSPKGGKVAGLGGDVGDTVEVGSVIARIEAAEAETEAASEQETPAEPAAEDASKTAEAAAEEETPEDTPAEDSSTSDEAAAESAAGEPAPVPAPREPDRDAARRVGPVPAAPATRRRARELGVDLHLVPGSGPAGRVSVEDVERFAEGGAAQASAARDESAAGPAAAGEAAGIPFLELEPLPDFSRFGPVETEDVRSIRRKVARKMTTSMILVPHVALMEDVDVTELEAFRSRERRRRTDEPGGRLSLLPFVAKAVTECLKEFPSFNASLDHFKNQIVYKKYYNIGIAADTPKGLLVPVVKSVDTLSILAVSAEIERLALAARDGKIAVEEMQGGTFTITNVGPIAGRQLIPTINHPEVAILGMGRAEDQPVVRDGEIVIRTILPLTLTFDHRITDGADAARFMKKLKTMLAEPLNWLLELGA